jgi:hypothetical protein
VHTGFWWGNLREGEQSEDPCIGGRIILKWILEKWDGDMDWIDVAEDREFLDYFQKDSALVQLVS